jgi:hypothetical protein
LGNLVYTKRALPNRIHALPFPRPHAALLHHPDLIHAQEECAKLKQKTSGKSKSAGAARGSGDDKKAIEELKRKLADNEAKEGDFDM